MNLNRQGVLLNTMMLTALTATIAGAISRFVPAWQPGYIVVASALVALEASLVHFAFRREHMWLSELGRYIVPELTVMLFLMRIATTFSLGLGTLSADVGRWLYDPLSIFDMPYVLAIIAGMLIGWFTHISMQDLSELAPHSFDTPQAHQEESQQIAIATSADRAGALRRISNRFIIGGVILLFALGLESVNIERLSGPSRAVSRLSAAGALVYLISGFLLYSQARFALLRSRWQNEGAQVGAGVAQRWTRSSWMVIAGVALGAVLLPRSYGMGLLDTLRGLLGLIGYALAVLGYLIIWIFSLLALIPAWILSFLFIGNSSASTSAPAFVPPNPPPEIVRQPLLLPALVFWMCMVLLTGYALWIVAQRHPGVARALVIRGPLGWLLQRLGWVWRGTRSWAGQVVHVVQKRLHRPPAPARPARAWLRLRGLAPRDLVRYFYRSTLRRAAEQGLPRRENQTPYEYGATLSTQLPDAQQDITTLTDSFVAAEYGPRPVSAEEARRARKPWERIRRRLRRGSPNPGA